MAHAANWLRHPVRISSHGPNEKIVIVGSRLGIRSATQASSRPDLYNLSRFLSQNIARKIPYSLFANIYKKLRPPALTFP